MAFSKHDMTVLLRQINRIRVIALGADSQSLVEMPKGIPEDARACPIALALSNGLVAEVGGIVTLTLRSGEDKDRYDFKAMAATLRKAGFKNVSCEGYHYYGYAMSFVETGVSFDLTATMLKFVQQFDNLELPSLIDGSHEL
jgi:hypothetical protein